jgi:DNA mismatch repair protein MutS2
MDEYYFEKIEFTQIRQILSNYCKTYIGKDKAIGLLPYLSLNEINKAISQTTEALKLIFRRGNVPIEEIADITIHLKKIKDASTLSITELLDVANILKISRQTYDYFFNNEFDDNQDDFKLLNNLFNNLYKNVNIEKEIYRCIIDENTIDDHASPELLRIRRSKKNKESEIKNKLNTFLNSKYVQDAIITIRDGRYVIPIKSEYKADVKGFVHDVSSSGSTFYIEPMAIFEINNEIISLETEEKIEIEKILQKLSGLLFGLENEIENTINLIGLLDFIFAKAKFSKDYDMNEPIISNDRVIQLNSAWHPLIDKDIAVKNDICVGNEFNTLIITGPNTGGKTVSIKTVGLLALMALSGMHITAGENSKIPFFDNVFLSIGNEQSISDSLSTFSAHIKNIVKILEKVSSKSLVLLDELGTGTDPVEGAALGISILEKLQSIGCLTLATTHYPQIKEYAIVAKGFENASVEFDMDNMSPTYKLLIGIPGESNAFIISKKLGIDTSIIDRAKELIDDDQLKLEELINSLHRDKSIIEKERINIEEKSKKVTELEAKLSTSMDNAKFKEKQLIEKARADARQILIDAKEEVNEIIKKAEKAANLGQQNKLRNRLNDKIKTTQAEELVTASNKAISIEDVKIGKQVFVPSLSQSGNIISLPDKDNNVLVQLGVIKMTLNINQLEASNSEQKNIKKDIKYNKEHSMRIKAISPEINVIGKNVDEACMEIDKYLDECALSGLISISIIHGKGTGILRKGVQSFLKTHPHVKSFRDGLYGEGEQGVTIVELK